MIIPNDLVVELPPGWSEHANPEGPREFRPVDDGSTGILQVSEFFESDRAFIAEQEDLGAFASELGRGLGTEGRNWGVPGIARQITSATGRQGVAMFTGGAFPAMVLWVTLCANHALMWTWLGPDPTAAAIGEAFEIVLSARFSRDTVRA